MNETDNKSKEEVEEKLNKLYYNPETEYCGIKELQRKSGFAYTVVKSFLDLQDTYKTEAC